jgi:toxin ParE1/3/4
MASVSKTPQAQADLEAILEELEERNPNEAERFAAAVDKTCVALGRFPELGRARSEILPELRSTLVRKYVLFYCI